MFCPGHLSTEVTLSLAATVFHSQIQKMAVISLPLGCSAALRLLLSLTPSHPAPLLVIATLTSSEEHYNKNNLHATPFVHF